VLVYKFPRLSREELREIVGIEQLTMKETRYYQEAREEGREERELRGKLALVPALPAKGFTLRPLFPRLWATATRRDNFCGQRRS